MQISFLLKLYTCVSNLKNPLIEFVKFAIIEATKGGTRSLKRFLEKISWYRPWYQEIERQVKNLMASLRCHGNSEVNKTWIITNFHLYVVQLW